MGSKGQHAEKKGKGDLEESGQLNPSTSTQGKKGNGPCPLTFFKVFATFKCSNDQCKRTWGSAHAWEREDDEGGIDCDSCNKAAKLVNAVDEMLKLDSYHCFKCENFWQSIHIPANSTQAQDCDLCNAAVFPSGPPQERFGRHYWFRCMNKSCQEKDCSEWEDFSINEQKTQRCTKCGSRGEITKISKLKQMAPWWKRKLEMKRRGGRACGGGAGEPDMDESPTNHVAEFCDMCQDIKRQGKGKNCRAWRVVKEEEVVDPQSGQTSKKIVEMLHASDNPFHYDTTTSQGESMNIHKVDASN